MGLNLRQRMGDDESDRQTATHLAAHGYEGQTPSEDFFNCLPREFE